MKELKPETALTIINEVKIQTKTSCLNEKKCIRFWSQFFFVPFQKFVCISVEYYVEVALFVITMYY